MTQKHLIKICGLRTAETLDCALDAGADMVGFVFFPPSPRNLGFDVARSLGERVACRANKVALSVDADDELLTAIVEALRPDVLQLHGHETPERVMAIRAKFSLPVMKAIGVSSVEDLAAIARYETCADYLLFDAKPPKGAVLPGGNGRAFDWHILDGIAPARPWMLSGGLDTDNVTEALTITRAPGLDVSSGVERVPGEKDPALISRFIAKIREYELALGNQRQTA